MTQWLGLLSTQSIKDQTTNKLTHDMLTKLGNDAKADARFCRNHNMHTELSDSIQQLAIAMEPETYIHRPLQKCFVTNVSQRRLACSLNGR